MEHPLFTILLFVSHFVSLAKFVDYDVGLLPKPVKGYISMDGPWWNMTIQAEEGQSFFFIKGHPAYRVRKDAQVGPQGIVALFMKACGVNGDNRQAFYDFLRYDQCVKSGSVTLASSVGMSMTCLSVFVVIDNMPEWIRHCLDSQTIGGGGCLQISAPGRKGDI